MSYFIHEGTLFEFAWSVGSTVLRMMQKMATVVRPNEATKLCILFSEFVHYETTENKATPMTR